MRFSFANERTFLAWIRTALAVLAAGVALDAVELSLAPAVQKGLAVLLVVAGVAIAASSWLRWAMAERAIRRREPLPSSGSGVVLAAVVLVAGIVLLATGL